MISDFRMMGIQAETLFVHDIEGRLTGINAPDHGCPPKFFLGWTMKGHICRFRSDLPNETIEKLEDLVALEPIPTDLCRYPIHLQDYQDLMQTDAKLEQIWIGPAYRFPDKVREPSNEVTQITKGNVGLLRSGFSNLIDHLESAFPVFAYVINGIAVSICCTARMSPQAAEAGVETMGSYRGKGYAIEVVTGWARSIRGLGRIPLYSTSRDNRASRKVATKLALIQYGVDIHFT